MGRKRVEQVDKRIRLTLTVQRKIVEELKEKNVNISRLFEEFAKNYLKR